MLEEFLNTGKIPEGVNLLREDFVVNKGIPLVEEGIKNFFKLLNYELKNSGMAQSFLVKKGSREFLFNVVYSKIAENEVRVSVIPFWS